MKAYVCTIQSSDSLKQKHEDDIHYWWTWVLNNCSNDDIRNNWACKARWAFTQIWQFIERTIAAQIKEFSIS